MVYFRHSSLAPGFFRGPYLCQGYTIKDTPERQGLCKRMAHKTAMDTRIRLAQKYHRRNERTKQKRRPGRGRTQRLALLIGRPLVSRWFVGQSSVGASLGNVGAAVTHRSTNAALGRTWGNDTKETAMLNGMVGGHPCATCGKDSGVTWGDPKDACCPYCAPIRVRAFTPVTVVIGPTYSVTTTEGTALEMCRYEGGRIVERAKASCPAWAVGTDEEWTYTVWAFVISGTPNIARWASFGVRNVTV